MKRGLLFGVLLVGCGAQHVVDAGRQDAGTAASTDAGERDGGNDAGAVDAGFSVVVLSTLTLDSGVSFQLLKITTAGNVPSYARWFPPPDGGPAPVVVMTQPYEGIDWTTEAVDARWAALGAGLHPDVDGPNWNDAGTTIVYEPQSHAAAADSAYLWRLHGFGVLFAYGRFYAGGDVDNDINDMVAGFDFLTTSPQVDRARIAIVGGSWGGFEALYGAALAPPEVRPAFGVALYPISDFRAEYEYITTTLPGRYTLSTSREKSARFFDPYLRRLAPTVTRHGGYAGLTGAELAAKLKTPFMVLHEDWDTLVSFEQSTQLLALKGTAIQPLWLLHQAPPSPWDLTVATHGQLLTQLGDVTIWTFAWASVLVRLGGAQQQLIVPWDTSHFRLLLSTMRSLQLAGRDVAFFAARLLDLMDARVVLFELNTSTTAVGATAIATEVSAVWGASWTPEALRARLTSGQLP